MLYERVVDGRKRELEKQYGHRDHSKYAPYHYSQLRQMFSYLDTMPTFSEDQLVPRPPETSAIKMSKIEYLR